MSWTKSADDRLRDAEVYGAEYRRNRALAMHRAGGRCEIGSSVCTASATTCDHIIPVSQGGTHALSNLRAACAPCHARKTAAEGGGYRRRTARDPEPRPVTKW